MTLRDHSPLSDPDEIAGEVLAALDQGRQIPPFTESDAGFDLAAAYRVAARVRHLREARGERVVGRKIGFTNERIWAEFGVDAPVWGYLYDSTVHNLSDPRSGFDLSAMAEPRIEPEIVFGLSRAPEPGMDERALLSCVGWVAHGYELVQSLFPGWRFKAADTVAAFGLHAALLLGPKVAVEAEQAGHWHEALAGFGATLSCNGALADQGQAANVLGGGPLTALRHLVQVLAADPSSPALAAGEVISTGTLTRALPIKPGETWSSSLSGLSVPDLTVSFN